MCTPKRYSCYSISKCLLRRSIERLLDAHFSLLYFLPKLTHTAARFVFNRWPTCVVRFCNQDSCWCFNYCADRGDVASRPNICTMLWNCDVADECCVSVAVMWLCLLSWQVRWVTVKLQMWHQQLPVMTWLLRLHSKWWKLVNSSIDFTLFIYWG